MTTENKFSIAKWKQWYQVKFNGYTVAQFLNKGEAKAFIAMSSPLPAADQHIGQESVCRRFGTTTRRISIYP